MEFAVVDIETTGGAGGGRVTEIAVFVSDGKKVLRQWHSLVNPGIPVPYNITLLTGIDDALLVHAPSFYEIADELRSILEGCVFVAHSVAFDYGVLKTEFALCRKHLNLPRLCTVRLSRKIFQGLPSYSLGRLCHSLNIPLVNRHRAQGDAEATAQLFHLLWSKDEHAVRESLKVSNREHTLPPALSRQLVLDLPELPGIYFFEDASGKVIYIGKAVNVQQRVWSHFRDYSPGKHRMKDRIAHVFFELSGSEVLAELMESEAIRKYYPEFNRAQKRVVKGFGLIHFIDNLGRYRLDVTERRTGLQLIGHFNNATEAIGMLSDLCNRYGLCKYLCYKLPQEVCAATLCELCLKKESIEIHNAKVQSVLSLFTQSSGPRFVKLPGRNHEEEAFIRIESEMYTGYGFVPKHLDIGDVSDLDGFLIKQEHNNDIYRILLRHKLLLPRVEKRSEHGY